MAESVRYPKNLRVLVVEDDPGDYHIIQRRLTAMPGWSCELTWVDNVREALKLLDEQTYDICLCDYYLGGVKGTELIEAAINDGCESPFLLLTGRDDRAVDLEAMAAGASDYVLKGDLTTHSIERAIRYSLERHESQRKLEQLAHYDSLTGLPNRLLFHQHLEAALELTGPLHDQGIALLFIDLDRFKLINDSFGHACGDELLIQVSQRLHASVRSKDVVARLGGDEFIVLLHGNNIEVAAQRVAECIEQKLSRPFLLGDRPPLNSSASIGVRFCMGSDIDAKALMRDADIAMYRAKAGGRGQTAVFDRTMHLEVVTQLRNQQELKRAMQHEELCVLFKPIVNLHTGEMVTLEAVAGWNHPRLGKLSAPDFLPLAEEIGVDQEIAWWVLEAALQHWSQWSVAWPAQKLPVLNLNLSRQQLVNLETPAQLAELMENYLIAPSQLMVGVPTDTLIDERAMMTLETLDALGLSRIVGDFAVSYSSLISLESLPLAGLKIGPTYIESLVDSPRRQAVLTAMRTLGRALDLSIIVGGVHTAEQCELLKELGFLLGQGSQLAPLMSPRDMGSYIRQFA